MSPLLWLVAAGALAAACSDGAPPAADAELSMATVAARVEAAEALHLSADAERDALSLAREASVRTARACVETSLIALGAAHAAPVERADEPLVLRGHQLGMVM